MRHTICGRAQDWGHAMAAVSGDDNQISILFPDKMYNLVPG